MCKFMNSVVYFAIMNYNIGKTILNCIIHLATYGLMALVVKQPLIKFLADLAKLPVFWLVGVSITEALGFDPVGDIAVGIQSLNVVMSTATGTIMILLIILMKFARKSPDFNPGMGRELFICVI